MRCLQFCDCCWWWSWRMKIVVINGKTAPKMDCSACIMQSGLGLYNGRPVGRCLAAQSSADRSQISIHDRRSTAAEAEDWRRAAWWIDSTDDEKDCLIQPSSLLPLYAISSNTLTTEKWLSTVSATRPFIFWLIELRLRCNLLMNSWNISSTFRRTNTRLIASNICVYFLHIWCAAPCLVNIVLLAKRNFLAVLAFSFHE